MRNVCVVCVEGGESERGAEEEAGWLDAEAQLCAGRMTERRLADGEKVGMREEKGRALCFFLPPSHSDDDC